MTDEWHAYKNIQGYYKHTFVDHGRKQYANEDTTKCNRMLLVTSQKKYYWGVL
jgi:hypothetical protein